MIPGQVDADLLNEHLARYAFAARLARGKRVLDAGCGAGYGAAELARIGAVGGGRGYRRRGRGLRARALPRCRIWNSNRPPAPRCRIPDAAFDLVVAFEVIEHLPDWRDFLLEARRVLAPTGQFIVSTPNKLYYAESRGRAGANPFHAHEFEFDEFRDELSAVFPHVSLFLENHVEGVAFRPMQAAESGPLKCAWMAGDASPAESHFFVAVCAHRPQTGNPTFVYVPSAGERAARARDAHRAARRRAAAEGRLAGRRQARPGGSGPGASQTDGGTGGEQPLGRAAGSGTGEPAARACQELQRNWRRTGRVQRRGRATNAKIAELEAENRAKSEWARAVERAARRQAAGTGAVRRVSAPGGEDRGRAHALGAIAQTPRWSSFAASCALLEASRWVRLGRRVGLGPDADLQ